MSGPVTFIDDLGELLGDEPEPGSRHVPPRLMGTSRNDDSGQSAAGGPAAPEGPPEPIPAITDESGMAALLGIGASQIRTKARDGILIRSGRGRYDVRASLARYLAQLRDAASRGGRQGQEEANRDLKAESIRVKRAQADAQELKNAASRGELLEATAVERQWASILRDVRAGLLAVPSRVGAKLPHLTAHDLAEIDREIRRSLERLSDGN